MSRGGAHQHRHASERCCRMVLALFCLTPSGIMSRMSCCTQHIAMVPTVLSPIRYGVT